MSTQATPYSRLSLLAVLVSTAALLALNVSLSLDSQMVNEQLRDARSARDRVRLSNDETNAMLVLQERQTKSANAIQAIEKFDSKELRRLLLEMREVKLAETLVCSLVDEPGHVRTLVYVPHAGHRVEFDVFVGASTDDTLLTEKALSNELEADRFHIVDYQLRLRLDYLKLQIKFDGDTIYQQRIPTGVTDFHHPNTWTQGLTLLDTSVVDYDIAAKSSFMNKALLKKGAWFPLFRDAVGLVDSNHQPWKRFVIHATVRSKNPLYIYKRQRRLFGSTLDYEQADDPRLLKITEIKPDIDTTPGFAGRR